MPQFPHVRQTEVDVPGAGQDTEGDDIVGPVPFLIPLIGETVARVAATLALQEAIMSTGLAPPSPPRPISPKGPGNPTKGLSQ